MAEDSLSILYYGPAGSGKTTLGLTAPSPILMFDAETASRFIDRKRKVTWRPDRGEALPELTGDQDVVVVRIKDLRTLEAAMDVLRTNRHPFRSIIFDSISEIEDQIKKSINEDQFRIQDWGELSRKMGNLLRELRDITGDDESPIQIMGAIAMADHRPAAEDQPESWGPLLGGAARKVAPYLFDITALVRLESVPEDPNNVFGPKKTVQTFYTGNSDPNISAKSRVPGLPPNISDLTFTGLHRNIFGSEPEETPEPPKEKSSSKAKPKASDTDNDVPTLPNN